MSAQYEILPPGGHETMLEAVFNKVKSKIPNDENVKQKNYSTYNGYYRILFSGSADDAEHIEEVGKSTYLRYNPWAGKLELSGDSIFGVYSSIGTDTHLEIHNYDISLLNGTWDGTHTSLKDTITYLNSQSAANKVDKAGDTMSGALTFTKNDGADIVVPARTISYIAGNNGNAGIYAKKDLNATQWYPILCMDTKSGGSWAIGNYNDENLQFSYATKANRDSSTNTTSLVILRNTAGTIALTSELTWNNIGGKPSTFPPSSHSHSYLPLTGGTLTGALTLANGTKNTIGDDVVIGDINRGGGLAIQGVTGDTNIYFVKKGNAWTNGANGNFAMTWNGSLMAFSGHTQIAGVLRVNAISRTDTGDSGYVNHVNPDNNAYRPVRASAFTTMSCKHTKTNVADISEEDALKLLDVRPVNFDYVEEVGGQKDQIGVLAEDTYEVLPKVVSVPDDYVEEDFDISKGIHQPLPSVDYAKFVPYLIKMVQIQQREINELRALVQSNLKQHL